MPATAEWGGVLNVPDWAEDTGGGVSPASPASRSVQAGDVTVSVGSAVVDACKDVVAGLAGAFDASLLARADAELATVETLAASTPASFGAGPSTRGMSGGAATLIESIRALEDLKNAACAAQARAEVLFAAFERARQLRAGVRGDALGKGTAAQIALARRESPFMGTRHLKAANRLVRDMPGTMAACTSGALTEYRAQIVTVETEFLSPEERARVDELIAGCPEDIERLGNKQLAAAVRAAAYQLQPAAFVKRLAKAETDRYVSLRPAADGMTLLTALLPLKQGIRVLRTLTGVADSARNNGDGRGKGQLMADALVHRLTEHPQCDGHGNLVASGARLNDVRSDVAPALDPDRCLTAGDAGIALDLIMTDRALFDGATDPAILTGYGPIPAPAARQMLMNTAGQAQVWLRRLYTHPETGALLSMDSRARLFPDGMKRFLFDQDQMCRTPWCDAPIREYDHIKSFISGGGTTPSNGQGLCRECNLVKEADGWSSEATGLEAGSPPGAPPGTRITTPTGHRYSSKPPPLPGAADPPGRNAGPLPRATE
jgi:hypothetical protein